MSAENSETAGTKSRRTLSRVKTKFHTKRAVINIVPTNASSAAFLSVMSGVCTERAPAATPAASHLGVGNELVARFPTFSIFLFSAYRKRRQPDWHKRLITFALFLSLEAAIQRLEWLPSGFGYWPVAAFLDICLLVPLVSYDVLRVKRLHPATVRGALVIFAAQGILFSLWRTAVWRHFAYTAMHAVLH